MERTVRILLPYGSEQLPVLIPERWLGMVARPKPSPPVQAPTSLVTAALDRPIACEPVEQLVRPGQRVVVIVDDYTRRTPAHLLLPPVLQRLHNAGIKRRDIQIVIALGTHRPMTQAELDAKLGQEIAATYEIVNHSSDIEEQMVYLGAGSSGIPAWVNRTVAEADVRIGVGLITPHLDAGFSGGAKMILPGVCSTRTVDDFHTASAFIPENQLGNIDAPLRQRLERFVNEQLPLHFIVNVVITADGELYHCVAGDAVAAHRAGVAHARQCFGVQTPVRYPVVVAGCAPYEFDLWQSVKGIWAGDLLTADGGTLIAVTAAPEGNSNYRLLPGYAGQDPETLQEAINAGTVEDGMQAATGVMLGRLMRRVRLAIVSDGLSPADATTMGARHYDNLQRAITEAVETLSPPARPGAVAFLPQAGITLPLVP